VSEATAASRMMLVGRNLLDEFCKTNPDARAWIENWLADVGGATWKTPHELRERFPSVSFLGAGTTIFNVKGNQYRLEASVAYKTGIVVIAWVGTHREYDQRNRKRR
jgi:mRNA interferase HigB